MFCAIDHLCLGMEHEIERSADRCVDDAPASLWDGGDGAAFFFLLLSPCSVFFTGNPGS